MGLKIKTVTKNQVIEIQKKVFNQGGTWFGGDTNIKEKDYYALYVDFKKVRHNGTNDLHLTYCNDKDFFKQCNSKEIDFESFVKIEDLREYIKDLK